MPTDRPPQPTPAELAILRVLWRRGRSTVREVLDVLNAGEVARTGGDAKPTDHGRSDLQLRRDEITIAISAVHVAAHGRAAA